jgi:hypothetical protein
VVALRPGLALERTWRPIHTGARRIPQGRVCCWTGRHCLRIGYGTRRRRKRSVGLTLALCVPVGTRTLTVCTSTDDGPHFAFRAIQAQADASHVASTDEELKGASGQNGVQDRIRRELTVEDDGQARGGLRLV